MTTTTATTKTQHTTEKQTTTQPQQPKTITITAQQAEQLAQQLGFKPIYKKAEAYIRHLEHMLRHIGREVRRRFLEELILKGEAELPALVVTGYRINWDALQTTLQQLLKETDLPEAVKKAMLERLRQLEEEIKEVPNTEELIKLIQKELGGLLEKPVINLASLYSSIASYLAEHGVSPSKIKQIIDEIQEKVFGKGVLYWMPSSPQEIEQKLKQLEQILAQNNIPIYETETKLVPLIIKNYVVKNPKELIEKWIEQKLGNTQEAKQVAQALYNALEEIAQQKGYTNLQNIPLTEFVSMLDNVIRNIPQINTLNIKINSLNTALKELMTALVHSPSRIERNYHTNRIAEEYLQGNEKVREAFERIAEVILNKVLPELSKRFGNLTWRSIYEHHWKALKEIFMNALKSAGFRVFDAYPWGGEVGIYIPGVGNIALHIGRIENLLQFLLGEKSLFNQTVAETYQQYRKISELKAMETLSRELPNVFHEFIVSPSVLESEFLKVGGKSLISPEKTVSYQMEISFKVPRFQYLITEELAAARHRAEEVLKRFYQEMHRIYSDLFRKVFRLVRVRLRII